MISTRSQSSKSLVELPDSDNVVIKKEGVDESYEEFYKTSLPVPHMIKTENIDPGYFVTFNDEETVNTGFISEIKLEDDFILKKASKIDAGCNKKKKVQDKSIESNCCESRTDSNGTLNTSSLESASTTFDSNVASEIGPVSTVRPTRNHTDNNITEKKSKSNSKTSVKQNKSKQQKKVNNDKGESKPSIETGTEKIDKRNDLPRTGRQMRLDKAYRERVEALIPKNMRYPIGNYECYSCSTNFTRLSSWEDHIMLYLKCRGCYPKLLKKTHFVHKGILTLDDGSFKCKECTYASLHKYDVKCHVIAHHMPFLSFKCALCTKSFRKRYSLKKHVMDLHNPLKIPFHCSHCDFKTNNKISLKEHIRVKHTKEGFIKCTVCTHLCSSKYAMRSHMERHGDMSKMKRYKCPLCNYTGLSQTSVTNHTRRKHENSVKYYCALCKYETTTKSYIETHIWKIHLKDSLQFKHKCSRCNKTFQSSAGLKYHQILHERDQNRFKCDLCNSHFHTKHELISHGNVEHRSKPELQCDECPFLGQTREEFKNHIFDKHRVTFYCALCPYKSNKKHLLNTHAHNRHDPNAKRLKCSACPYKAKTKVLLKQHFNIKHNPNAIVYTCFHCNHTTKIKHKLSQHMQDKHLKLLKRKKSCYK